VFHTVFLYRFRLLLFQSVAAKALYKNSAAGAGYFALTKTAVANSGKNTPSVKRGFTLLAEQGYTDAGKNRRAIFSYCSNVGLLDKYMA